MIYTFIPHQSCLASLNINNLHKLRLQYLATSNSFALRNYDEKWNEMRSTLLMFTVHAFMKYSHKRPVTIDTVHCLFMFLLSVLPSRSQLLHYVWLHFVLSFLPLYVSASFSLCVDVCCIYLCLDCMCLYIRLWHHFSLCFTNVIALHLRLYGYFTTFCNFRISCGYVIWFTTGVLSVAGFSILSLTLKQIWSHTFIVICCFSLWKYSSYVKTVKWCNSIFAP